ncbi:MAG: NfeD family protein [Candidatus Krumholzibacteria bacterium]|jgi:membrane-bound serine protease (ClpP class)|nr:NfeD family protein [Candidatus Krumholzibacteria bacterium]
MRRIVSLVFLLLSASLGLLDASENRLTIVEIPIEGTIEMGLAPFVERAIEEARDADAVLLRIDTFGGRIDAAVRIRDAILRSPVPTVAWVEGRAISAGALITLAADKVLLSEGASIGAAEPVQISPTGKSEPTGEKTVSYMRSEMRATAESRGRNPQIAEAMVDESLSIEGVIEAGKLLTLTAEEALDLEIANAVVADREEAYAILAWENPRVREMVPTWSEQMVRFLTHPVLAGLLLSLGGLGLLLEIRTPGFGVPGLVGIIALALYFGSHWLVHLAGNVEIFLFVAGVILLILEVFVIPGFGIAGISGAVLLLAGVLLSRMAPHGGSDDFTSALAVLLFSMIGTGVLFFGLLKYLPEARWMGSIVLETTQKSEEGFSAEQHDPELLGQQGVCLTDLRPSGTIRVEGQRLDAITDGEYYEQGTSIHIVEVQANRIVVERDLDPEEKESSST